MQYIGNVLGGGNSSALAILEKIKELETKNKEIVSEAPTISDCNKAVPRNNSLITIYTVSWAANMPINGNHRFVIFTINSYLDGTFVQIAICVRSTASDNIGRIFTRSCVNNSYGSWKEK